MIEQRVRATERRPTSGGAASFIAIAATISALGLTFAGLLLLGEIAPDMQYETALAYLILIFVGLLASALLAKRYISKR